MAEENVHHESGGLSGEGEVKDRGMFDFMKKKKDEEGKCEEEVLVSEFEKVKVEDVKVEEKKHESLREKLHRSGSSSSSSSDEEEVEGETKEKKKKKGLKEKIKEKISGEDKAGQYDKKDEVVYEDCKTSVPAIATSYDTTTAEVVKSEESVTETTIYPGEEKKGFLEKIKDKMPGGTKKAEEAPVVSSEAAVVVVQEGEGKKGFLEKIKEKLPGYHKSGGGDEHET
ncbi:Dehydrin COR410 [Acorus gramineus]|uniref:Dehydrin COR410 n=1 Tax=Acorus gramineus TaxID=55184 RepID=A0AAV9B9I5_ACOGR|nr:Dehydrin COR410 [Acorus gramineus]